MGKSIAFGWYGGKYSHLDWLLPLLPPSQHFCDVFGGSAAVIINRLPCNTTTAFLTPALRNRSEPLTTNTNLVGRPPELYKAALQLLDDVHTGTISADDLLAESIRVLLIVKHENQQRIETLLAGVKPLAGAIPLSAESIVSIVQSHLVGRNSSRLPVLIVTAAYKTASAQLGEQAKVLAERSNNSNNNLHDPPKLDFCHLPVCFVLATLRVQEIWLILNLTLPVWRFTKGDASLFILENLIISATCRAKFSRSINL